MSIGMNNTKSIVKVGFFAGLIGALCCVTPLVLVLIGFSGVAGAMALSGNLVQYYRWTLFIPLASIFLIGAIYFHVKRKSKVCNLKTLKKHKSYVIATILFAAIVWVVLLYVIVPIAFSLIS